MFDIGRQSLLQFTRIVTLNHRELKPVVSAYAVDDGEVRVQHSKLFGLDIEDANIMRAKKAT
jgi:hypothetical protein